MNTPKATHLVRPSDMTQPKNGPGYTRKADPVFTKPSSARVSNGNQKGTYKGDELRPYQGRPDANDHMQCGSVEGGVWKPYTPPGLMCVGAAGPVPLSTGQVRYAK